MEQLKHHVTDNQRKHALTTNQGVKIAEDEFSLKMGLRGPTLMEDFHFREKMTHFDHERIPERIVHARGVGAHGYFQLYESLEAYTKADFLTNPSKKTPVFVRFSTVQGSKGSNDTVRDVRGFATKFYTDEGNYDLVGNNMPVFFIQDAIKFPDFVHAVKPEPHNDIPQGASAHDTFWDFVAHNPESTHMVMWQMSDRAIPRSLRMMEGFGVHTFRLINKEGKAHFVKFHWKPALGVHSLVWDEAQKIAGKNPDFHRQDLYEAIEKGDYPEWELGLQLIPEEDEHTFDFDILDPTKLWPEEEVPVKLVGKMTLNKNVDNFFAETEQVAFHPGHVVPGIQEKIDGHKIRGRSKSFLNFYSQAKLFYNSMSPIEKQHIKEAFCFEVGKCKSDMVKANVIALLNHVDRQLAQEVANIVGAPLPKENHEVNSDAKSPALSMSNTIFKADSKNVAIVLNGDPSVSLLSEWIQAFAQHRINYSIIDNKIYQFNDSIKVTDTYTTTDSSLFDAVLVFSSESAIHPPVLEFAETTFKHFKPIAHVLSNPHALDNSKIKLDGAGIYNLANTSIESFIEGIAQGRFWNR